MMIKLAGLKNCFMENYNIDYELYAGCEYNKQTIYTYNDDDQLVD